MYGFRFHDASGYEPFEETFETYQSCLEAMNRPFYKTYYPWPFGIDFVNEDDGFVQVIASNFVQIEKLKED